jgi:hypothetical protein
MKKETLDRSLWKTCFERGYGPVVRWTKWWRWSYLSVEAPSSAARLCSCRNCGRSPRSECSWITHRGSSWPHIPMMRVKFGSLMLANQLTSRRNSCLV